jgi:hypothetical protein
VYIYILHLGPAAAAISCHYDEAEDCLEHGLPTLTQLLVYLPALSEQLQSICLLEISLEL